MKMMKTILTSALLMVAAQLFTGCERRPLEDEHADSALISVSIDWSRSNIPVTDPSGNGLVHRVSIRFFPKDGSPAFDRYLEMNVMEGKIEVPIGEYSVVIFNESVHDLYWEDVIVFSDIDSYDDFSATIQPDDAANYDFYTPLADERLIVEPLRLASWSLDDFSVTQEIVTRTRTGTRAPNGMETALTHVVMRPLTYTVNVTAHVENLKSAQFIQGAMRGFAQKVYVASAETTQEPATHVFRLNSRRWDDATQVHGTVSKGFLSFGWMPQASQYMLNMDVVFVTGEIYDQPLLYDVTDQVESQPHTSVNIEIEVDTQLPLVEGGIWVGDWDDEQVVIQ